MVTANPNVMEEMYQPLLNSGVITGASVFDADLSSVANPPFSLERALFSQESQEDFLPGFVACLFKWRLPRHQGRNQNLDQSKHLWAVEHQWASELVGNVLIANFSCLPSMHAGVGGREHCFVSLIVLPTIQ